jgi:hypothetical protein
MPRRKNGSEDWQFDAVPLRSLSERIWYGKARPLPLPGRSRDASIQVSAKPQAELRTVGLIRGATGASDYDVMRLGAWV